MIVHFRTPTFPPFFPSNKCGKTRNQRPNMSVAEDWTAFSVSWMSSVRCWRLPGACGSAPPGDPLRHGAPKAFLGDTRLGRFLEIFRHRWHGSSKHNINNTCINSSVSNIMFVVTFIRKSSFCCSQSLGPNPRMDGVQLIGNPAKSPKTVMVFKSWPHEWGVLVFPYSYDIWWYMNIFDLWLTILVMILNSNFDSYDNSDGAGALLFASWSYWAWSVLQSTGVQAVQSPLCHSSRRIWIRKPCGKESCGFHTWLGLALTL